MTWQSMETYTHEPFYWKELPEGGTLLAMRTLPGDDSRWTWKMQGPSRDIIPVYDPPGDPKGRLRYTTDYLHLRAEGTEPTAEEARQAADTRSIMDAGEGGT